MEAIRIENAGKCIKGTWIFQNVTVSFESGKIHGLIGRNGAGKTMLMKSICGLTRISTGTITVQGKKVGVETDIPDSIGAILDAPGQRLGIAQAIMEDPDILLLDEPMNGLDNQGVEDMRALFRRLREEGKTILLASHHKEDIEELCDTVCSMDRGMLKLTGP